MPDIFCIANCGTWSALKLNINPNIHDTEIVRLAFISAYGHKDLVVATYMNSNDAQEINKLNPIGECCSKVLILFSRIGVNCMIIYQLL